jgi:hypothetical protein
MIKSVLLIARGVEILHKTDHGLFREGIDMFLV